ncbi:OHCU decarboxylase [Moraxella osloensis]|uniref:2-oxo-4-hydroxy-4-carboxy-5-ureidoimidazoline decarboxylase n=1 Tax=Faucicola osloensis TaxID=34062 RepID=A0A378QV46_FAUOS|nr:2-oxo-4-hydroxy-4-carboxy-5-ureidoimidazoline decarboxylase [Moraxella osloensis]AME02462.1 OHCU decarboxylase [Moraxella osloensis]OBX52717.1 OHCU decarboxylase [Moraxella osloensis]STZ04789.1 Uric acid degradation bifunctional protein [Moraxella osloensis]
MNITEFNQLSPNEAETLLKNCVQINEWANRIVTQRPFSDSQQLYNFAKDQAMTWTWQQISDALGNHPRIGEKKAIQSLNEREQQFSKNEQSNVNLTNAVQDALYKGNVDYENKFGFIFLIRALGRSTEEILAELNRRLNNTPEQEQLEVKDQLSQIALLRLKQEVTA